MTSCPQANLLCRKTKVSGERRIFSFKPVARASVHLSSRGGMFFEQAHRVLSPSGVARVSLRRAQKNMPTSANSWVLSPQQSPKNGYQTRTTASDSLPAMIHQAKQAGTRENSWHSKFSKISFSLMSFFFLLMITIQPALATAMDSENYHVETGGFSMTSGSKSSANFTIHDIVGSGTTSSFDSNGFTIQTGLSYLSGNNPFTFSLSATSIDFGTLTPNHPEVKTIDALVSNGSSAGYKVLVAEQLPLTSVGKATIPDTSCDTPGNPCANNKAGVWIKASTYGFGINLTGKGATADFRDASYYRPLANLSKGQSPTLIMTSDKHNATDQASVNLKVNVSSIQPVGNYQNNIYFVALPGY